MSNFDFFGTEDPIENEQSNPELELSFEFDYENLLTDGNDKNVKLCASVKPSDELRRSFEKNGGSRGAHICLIIDTSDSMRILVDDSDTVSIGQQQVGEDGKLYSLVKGGITKLKVALDSAKRVVDMLRPEDTLSCITYNDSAQILFEDLRRSDRNQILQYLDFNRYEFGMNTNISEALLLADKVLAKYEDALPKRVLFFTDGEPTGNDTEGKGIAAGKLLASHNVVVESMGFGIETEDEYGNKEVDVNFPYLQKISSASGGITSLINYPDEFASVFASLFAQSQSIIVTNVKLVLRLVQGTKIFDYYRGTPDNVYLGTRNESDERVFEINLGQIEKNQEYKYYFNVLLPGVDDYEGVVNTMSAELHYYVPGKHNDEEQIIKVNVPVNYTSDEDEAKIINGNVNVLFRLAEVKRFDEEREKAFNAGNEEETIKWIRKIITVYTELQKPVEAQAYTDMLNQYMKTHSISKVVLNKATSSSSQAQETGILDDLDDEEVSDFANRLKRRRKH